MSKPLKVNILTSTDPSVSFDKTSTPLIAGAFEDNNHQVITHSSESLPSYDELLDCDVFVDRSPITDPNFFRGLARAYRIKRLAHTDTPLMVDNPLATIIASDKRKTHKLFPDLVPESYDLDGITNHSLIDSFKDDEYVVIKNPLGWYSIGTELISPEDAHDKYGEATDLVVQKYIPFTKGVGRVVAANFDSDFQVLCSYTMIPDSWRTGEGVASRFELTDLSPSLEKLARMVAQTSGIYLNGMDYIESDGKYVLLENNTVPNLRVPYHYMGVNAPHLFVEHVERSAGRI
ncbi:MAG TPA: hypothetical protein VMU97_01140 [Candidatus Dormibacteraeota bacterium]|nr:hypothetical protein [Candidatus Dormibacteraeota bacterium]